MKIKLKDHARQLWLSLLLLVGVAAIAVPGLNGTNDSEIVEISTVDQLKDFRDAVNSGNQFAGKTVKLTADLDLSGESNWTPIGNLVAYPSQSFNGTFDGDGHSISNLTVNDNTPDYAVAGLFGSVVNGTIKNLTVKNVNITSTHYAGGIVAYTSNGPTIENCHVIGGTIKSTPELLNGSYDNGDKVGGIMGYATAGSTINNCTVEGVTITAYRDLGGIVGYSAGTVSNNTVINVTVTQDLTNGYKNPTPTTIGDIIGRDGGATLSNNKVINGDPVAQIGDEKYYSLADAVAAAQQTGGAVTVNIISDISGETVTIQEVPNFKLTIDGKKDASSNYTVDARIIIDGLRQTSGAGGSPSNGASVTLQNIAFVNSASAHGIQSQHYSHHVTIQNCTYSGSDNTKWFFDAGTDGPLYGVTIKNVTVEHARLIQANLSADAVFENIVATNDVYCGFNVKTGDSGGYTGTLLIKNCQVTTGKYAFRDYSDGYTGTITLEDNTFISTSEESDEGVIVNRGGAVGTGHINVVSGTYTGHVKVLNNKEGVLAISGGYFSEEFPQEYLAADLVAQGKVCAPAPDMEGYFTVGDPHYVAQIGETGYVTLQAAADAAHEMTGDVTITLLDDIAEYAVVHQKAGLNLTIDGADKNVAGQIFIDGNGRAGGTETLTIKNISFEGNTSNFYSGTDAFILVPSTKDTGKPWSTGAYNYAHNITVTDCSFKSTSTSSEYDVVCIKATSGAGAYNVVINNCTASGTKMHSLAQLTGTTGGTVTNCTVTGSESFVNVSGGTGDFTVSGNTFTSDENASEGYGIRENGTSTAVITLTDNNFTAANAVLLGKTTAVTAGTINVESGIYTGSISKTEAATGKIVVSGGYFSEEVAQDYIVEGKVCVSATDKPGYFTIGDPTYVAQIGETKYVSLQAAVDAAHEMTGDVTITLIDNIEGYSIVHQKAGLNLTIDGVDKTLAGQIFIDGDGRASGTETLTIQNIKFEDDLSNFYSGTDAFVLVPSTKDTGKPYTTGKYNYAHNITISDCSFNSTAEAFKAVGFKSNSGAGCYNIVMSNVTGNNLHSLAQLTGTTGATFDNCSATLTGSFIGANGGGGTYTVSNCTFESHPDKADGYAYREKSSSTAVATLTNNNFNAFDAIILGSAGTINVESGTYIGNVSKTAGNIVISGGQFSVDLTDTTYEPFIAEGKIGVQNNAVEAAPYSVEDGTYVAQVTLGESTHKYGSLEAAFAAAADGSTVKLLDDCAGNGIVVPQGKYTTGLTVDFDNHTYTVDGETVGSTGTETNGFQLLKDNTITFKNGTITSTKAKILVQNYSNLTLEGMTLTLNNENYNEAYTLSNNNGNVVIDGTTINANPAGGFAFDVCRYSSYESVSVTVTGDSEINGNVEVYASGSDAKNGFSLMLESGNITGNIVIDATARAAIEATPDKAVIKENDSFNQAEPAGFKWVSNGDGTSTLTPMPYVAQIGDVKYWSLADAIAAVPADGTETTITMIDDETIVGNAGVTIPVGKNIVLDLNGKTVTLSVTESKASQLITNRGTLTITDSSEGQNGKLTNVADESLAVGSWPTNNYVTNVVTNSGTLNMEAGNIISTANGSICYAIDNNSTSYDAILNIKGGHLTSVGTVIRQFCNSTTKQNVINMTGGVVTTNGSAAIWTQLPGSNASSKKLATLNISGGEISASSYAWYDYSYGDSFEAVEYNISGGKFTGGIYSYAIKNGVIDGFISGGLFSNPPSSSYIKTPGYMFGPSEEVEGYYTLVLAEVDYSWTQNGKDYHDYLAFNTPFTKNYLMDGESITLLQDITLTEDLTWNTEGDATFTLNLGEFKITKGSFSVKLKPGQTVNASKSAAIFTTDEAGYYVKSTKNADETYTYTVEEADLEYTAVNGTVSYKAWSNTVISGGGTYKLLKDITASARIVPGTMATNVTLDLNGHTLTSTATDCAILLSRAGSATSHKTFDIVDTSENGGGKLVANNLGTESTNSLVQVTGKYNDVTIGENVTIEGGCVAMLSENQTLTVNGTINGGNDFAVATNGSSTKNTTVTINEGAVLTSDVTALYLPGNEGVSATINGGTITGGDAGIEVRAGNLVINGGTITTTATEYDYTPNGSGTTTKGAAIAVVQHNTNLPIDAQILGGTLTGLNQIAVVDAQDNNLDGVSVKAKDDLIITTTIPEAFKWASNGDGTSSLVPKTFVAQIEGGAKYETLAEAVAAAGTSETTITLLEEAAVDGVISGTGVVVPSGSNITFDLNGLTYNVTGSTVGSSGTETQGFQLLKESNITFKNGTLKATSPTAQMVIQNYSNLTLEDVTIDGTGLSGWAYALSNNCGTINLTGSTSIIAKEGGRAFDTCKFGSYDIPTVNINTTGTITGPIEATGGKLNIENGKFDVTWVTDSHYAEGDIQITGGVFTEKPAVEYCAEGYVPTFNTDPETKADYPYAVKSKDDDVYELIDTENYPFMDLPSDIAVSSVTYKRSFSSTQVGKHQAWFVPMDYTITADDAANFTFYKIQMIAGAAEAGEADHDKIYLYIEPMNEGEVLKGNRPYTVKPKNVVTDYEFTAENTTLYAPTTKSRLNVTTSFHSYDFYGKYANDPYTGNIGDWFSLAQGSLHPNPASTTFRQYRWIIKVTANTINDDYSKIEFSIVEDGDATGIDRTRVINSDDVEGIYTTNGMKVDEPVRGINIIRYKNGKTEKIIVK